MHFKNRRRVALATTTLLALAPVAACGSGSDKEPAAAHGVQLPTVSRAAFAQQGNALCRANSEAIGSKFRAMSNPPKPAELKAAYDNMLKESYKINGDLLAIGAPKGKERALLDTIVKMQKVTETVEKQGQDAFFADEDSDPWAEAVHTLVHDFGLTDCGHDG